MASSSFNHVNIQVSNTQHENLFLSEHCINDIDEKISVIGKYSYLTILGSVYFLENAED